MPLDWPNFLDDFQRHWPTDENIYVEFVREGVEGNGAARSGNPRWRRLTELRVRTVKSVFHFDVQGSVAKSTHSGIPWLRYIRQQAKERLHFWPFDGWEIPASRSVIAEVYPALWSRVFPLDGRTPDQHDAFAIANGCREQMVMEVSGNSSTLKPQERKAAEIEGWILGVL